MQEQANNPTVKSEFDILQLLPRVANDNQVPCWYCPKYSKGTKKQIIPTDSLNMFSR